MKQHFFLTMTSLQLFGEEPTEAAVEMTEGAEAAMPEEAPEAPQPETDRKDTVPQGILALLGEKYSIDPSDTAALEQAIREEQESSLQGPSATEQQYARGAARIYDGWMAQAAQTGEIYPDFDLKAEMRNPMFLRLLRSSVDVKTAYEVVHKDEIIPAAMQYAARTVEQKLASSLRSSGNRPAENGMNSQGAVMLGSDVARLSRKDYAEICRRVERGERVSFG